jgi:hypothetical protein
VKFPQIKMKDKIKVLEETQKYLVGKFFFFFFCRETSPRQDPSDPPLQSKPQSRAPHPWKFPYMELVKSLAFHREVWPQEIVCTYEVLNLGP